MDGVTSSSSLPKTFSLHGGLKPSPKPTKPRPTAPIKQYKQQTLLSAAVATPKVPSLPVRFCDALDDFVGKFIHGRRPLRPWIDPNHVLADNFAPIAELEPTKCIVEEGLIPQCIEGAYIHNGPNPQFIPRAGDAYHLFDGDGMLHCIRLARDGATFCARFVKTYKYVQERDAGSSPLFLSVFSGIESLAGFLGRAAVLALRVLTGQFNPPKGWGQANTSVALVHGTLIVTCVSAGSGLLTGTPPKHASNTATAGETPRTDPRPDPIHSASGTGLLVDSEPIHVAHHFP